MIFTADMQKGEPMSDLIDRQAAIDALDGNVIVTSRESAQAVMDYIRGCADRIRSLPSAQPDLDSAYTEGYTAAESKYRKMWDEMQANIKANAFGKRKGLVHTADIDAMPTIEERKTGKWIHQTKFGRIECDQCGKVYRNAFTPKNYCPNCGARLVQEGEEHDKG